MDYSIVDSSLEREDIIDFINYVFSQAHCPHNFKTLAPKAYADENNELGAEHYYVKKDGRIKALVANRTITLSVMGQKLKVGTIGNVSVHPYSRGEGYMKELLQYAIDKAQANGTDLLALGGQRQRYGYFGFEHAGIEVSFRITKANIRHCFSDLDCSDISFSDLKDADEKTVEKLLEMYKKRPVHCDRPAEEFILIMQSWNQTTRVIMKNGTVIGYCYGDMSEVILENEADYFAVMKAYFGQFNPDDVTVHLAPFETQRIAELTKVCENVSINSNEMIRVLNWKNVLEAFLKLKAEYTTLKDGSVEFAVDDKAYRISVTDGVPAVCEIPAEGELEHFTQNTAQMLFFGVQSTVTENKKFANWLPLPSWLDGPDLF